MSISSPHLCLVSPPSPYLLDGFPTGALISLANFIQAANPEVHVSLQDFTRVDNDLQGVIAAQPGLMQMERLVVGISTVTPTYHAALAVARVYKALRPDCVVLLGGHHATPEAEVILNHHPEVDFIICGEGERALSAFMRNIDTPWETPGLAYRGANGAVIRRPPAELLTEAELDVLPITFGCQGLVGTPGKFDTVSFMTARGCPLSCSFCAVAKTQFRSKSVPKVIEHLRTLIQRGYTRISIEDNFFAHNLVRTKALCNALTALRAENVPLAWDCQTRVESLARDDIVPLMAAAGCVAAYIGVEALEESHLRYLNKTANPARYLHLLQHVVVPRLLQSPIDCYINLQLGLPHDDDTRQAVTLRTLQELGQQALQVGKTITVFPQLHVVYPGTRHFFDGVATGQFPRHIFESFAPWEAEQTPILHFLGHHFAHGTGGLPVTLLEPSELAEGRFVIDPARVAEVERMLSAVELVPDITLFRYGQYLVPTGVETAVDVSSESRSIISSLEYS